MLIYEDYMQLFICQSCVAAGVCAAFGRVAGWLPQVPTSKMVGNARENRSVVRTKDRASDWSTARYRQGSGGNA